MHDVVKTFYIQYFHDVIIVCQYHVYKVTWCRSADEFEVWFFILAFETTNSKKISKSTRQILDDKLLWQPGVIDKTILLWKIKLKQSWSFAWNHLSNKRDTFWLWIRYFLKKKSNFPPSKEQTTGKYPGHRMVTLRLSLQRHWIGNRGLMKIMPRKNISNYARSLPRLGLMTFKNELSFLKFYPTKDQLRRHKNSQTAYKWQCVQTRCFTVRLDIKFNRSFLSKMLWPGLADVSSWSKQTWTLIGRRNNERILIGSTSSIRNLANQI